MHLNNTFIHRLYNHTYNHNTKMTESIKNCDLNAEPSNKITYRYDFSKTFIEKLSYFAKLHQNDERKQFKEAWVDWMEENKEEIDEEYRVLTELGYEGDMNDKMFQSVRYYFRKKPSVKKEPQLRTSYVKMDSSILKRIDEHIRTNLNMKPHECYQLYKEQDQSLKEEPSQVDEDKLKKTFKNRCSVIHKSLSK